MRSSIGSCRVLQMRSIMLADTPFVACRPESLTIKSLPTMLESLGQGLLDTHHPNCVLGAKIASTITIAGQSLEVVGE